MFDGNRHLHPPNRRHMHRFIRSPLELEPDLCLSGAVLRELNLGFLVEKLIPMLVKVGP